MRGTALSLALFGLALAAPTATTEQPIESRQKGGVIKIGEPGSGGMNPSKPGDGCNKEIWDQTGYCVILGPVIKPSATTKTRRDDINLGGGDAADLKAAIKQAQLELQALQAKKNPTRADKKRIEALQYFIEKTSGVIKIVPPSGGSTVLLPGRAVTTKTRRDASKPGGSPCLVDLEKYAKELQEFLLSFPPWERARIWAQLIQGVCGIQIGPIVPDPTTSGAPVKPDPVTSGAPLKPGKV
ncbi:hypothetical protein RB595_001445 [Gaeumannomyces hyphopodioides]